MYFATKRPPFLRADHFLVLASPQLFIRLTVNAMPDKNRDPAQLRLKQIAGHVAKPQVTDYPVPHYASTTPTTRLKDKVAIITGCNSDKGIGRATATTFAANGAKAIVIGDLVSSNLRTWADEIGKRYPNTVVEWKQFDASGMAGPVSLLNLDEMAVKNVVAYYRWLARS